MINDQLISWLEVYDCTDGSLMTFCHASSIVDFDSLNWAALSEMISLGFLRLAINLCNPNKNSFVLGRLQFLRGRPSQLRKWISRPIPFSSLNSATLCTGVQSSLTQYAWEVLIVLTCFLVMVTSVASWMDLLAIYDIFCISSKPSWLRIFHIQSNILSSFETVYDWLQRVVIFCRILQSSVQQTFLSMGEELGWSFLVAS